MAISYAVGVNSPSNLWQLLKDYCESNENTYVANIPTFVQLAEERIFNTVQLPTFRKNQTGALTALNQYLTLPSDWLSTFSLALIDNITGAQTYLINKDTNFIRESFPLATFFAQPSHYAQFDSGALILGPTPDASYPIELHYFYYPPSIVTAGTSWLGTNFENVLLYGCIREAYRFQKGEIDTGAEYEKMYQEGITMLKLFSDGKNRSDAYRSGQARYPVP